MNATNRFYAPTELTDALALILAQDISMEQIWSEVRAECAGINFEPEVTPGGKPEPGEILDGFGRSSILPIDFLRSYIESLGIDPKKLDAEAKKSVDLYIRYRVGEEAQTTREAVTADPPVAVGEKVLLRSADVIMCVRRVIGDNAECQWFDSTMHVISATFPLSMLFVLRGKDGTHEG